MTDGLLEIQRKAEHGDVSAQINLGSKYFKGDGVTKDAIEAAKWFRKAAEQGDARAQCLLGALYEKGDGVPKDAAQAVKWYRKAADQGCAPAQFNLGVLYFKGEGVSKDAGEAAKWYRKAADQGEALAQRNLGVLYYNGEGVPRDDAEAAKWLHRAAEQGNDKAQFLLGGLYDNGKGVPENSVEAATWYRKAAEQGLVEAQLCLGLMYADGEGMPENYVLAYSWFSLAAAQGQAEAKKQKDGLAQKMTREQIAEAQKIAAAYRKANDQKPSTSGAAIIDATGSGFFVTADGYFVTNYHVIADAARIQVRTIAGTFPAATVRTDATNDLAVLKITKAAGEFSSLPVRGSKGVKIADQVATLGFPNPELQGLAAKYSSGEVAALSGPGDDPRFLQISVPIQPGNSGGALVDSRGCVVGVVVGQLDKIATLTLTGSLPENVNYAVKGTILLGLLEAVPGLSESVQSEPPKLPKDAAEVSKALEAASGMVLVER